MSVNEPGYYVYEFRPFRLETKKNILFRGEDEEVRLRPSEFGILLYLIENRERTVSLDELYDEFFLKEDPDRVVEENNVHQKISALRKALGEKRGENKYIQTIEGGYRFVAKNLVMTKVRDGGGGSSEIANPPSGELEPQLKLPAAENNPAAQHRAERSWSAQNGAEDVIAGDLKDGMGTFEGWLTGSGKFIASLLLVCVIATLVISVEGIRQQWALTNVAVSIAHVIFLLIALVYPVRGPKEFLSLDELTDNNALNRNVRLSTSYENPWDWSDACEIAQKSLRRYKIYWRYVLVTWFLLYVCLTFVVHPHLDLDCQIDTSRFCASNVIDPAGLATALKSDQRPLSQYLRNLLPSDARQELDAYAGSSSPPESLQRALLDGINQRLKDCCLYDEERFANVVLPDGTRELGEKQLKGEIRLEGDKLINFNRSLLVAAYPLSAQEPWKQSLSMALQILNTLLNNCSSLMIILCFNILNKPIELKDGSRNISDTSLSVGLAFVAVFTVVEILLVMPPLDYEKYQILKWGGWASGIFGGIAMALYFGRLQSKFLGPRSWLLISLYSYTAIQSLFVFLEERRTAAVVLIDCAMILKCLLFLYVTWLFRSGRLLFYFVRVRHTYHNVKPEWRIFRNIIKIES
jgi:DNA-binding winged helix-turn-helix (wHTH) protein